MYPNITAIPDMYSIQQENTKKKKSFPHKYTYTNQKLQPTSKTNDKNQPNSLLRQQ